MGIKSRRRGTAIVDTAQGILVTAGGSGVYLLPGGGAEKHETRMMAAMRELREETGLEPYEVKFLFRHKGHVNKAHGHGYFQDHHTVCLIQARGKATPRHEIRHVAFFTPGCHLHVSGVTRDIINRYYAYKKKTRMRQKQTSFINKLLDLIGL